MSQFTIVAEGEHDVALLRALLDISSDSERIKLVAAGGISAVDSMARSYLMQGGTEVALVVDADTTDPDLITEQKKFYIRSLGEIAGRSRWNIQVIAPEIEGLLFEDRSVIEQLVGHSISDVDFVRGSYEPKRVLRELAPGRSLHELFSTVLPGLDLSRIRETPAIRELAAFIQGPTPRTGTRSRKSTPQPSRRSTPVPA